MKTKLLSVLAVFAMSLTAAMAEGVIWLNAAATPAFPYDSAENGFVSPREAYDYAYLNGIGEICVAPGSYDVDVTLSITNAVVFRKVGDGEAVFGGSANVNRFILNDDGACIEGLTLVGSTTGAIVINKGEALGCTFRGNLSKQLNGALIYLYGGFMTDCVASNVLEVYNYKQVCILNVQGGVARGCTIADADMFGEAGVYVYGNGVLTNCVIRNLITKGRGPDNFPRTPLAAKGNALIVDCVITNNGSLTKTANGAGGLVCGSLYGMVDLAGNAVMRNSLVAYNSSRVQGGVAVRGSGAAMENCTVYGNKVNADITCDGKDLYLSAGRVQNCIIWGNSQEPDGGIYKAGGSLLNSLVFNKGTVEDGCVVGIAPVLKDPENGDFTPVAGQCISVDAGATLDWMTADARDLCGNMRVIDGAPDMGAFEAPTHGDILKVKAEASAIIGFAFGGEPFELGLSGSVLNLNADETASFYWYLGDEALPFGMEANVTKPLAAGEYTIRLLVKTSTNREGRTSLAVRVMSDTVYVSKAGSNTFPYDSLDKATPSIVEALNVLQMGDISVPKMCVISNDTYKLELSTNVSYPVSITSAYGRATLDMNSKTKWLTINNDKAEFVGMRVTNAKGVAVTLNKGTIKDLVATGGVAGNQAAYVTIAGGLCDGLVVSNFYEGYSWNSAIGVSGSGVLRNFLLTDAKGFECAFYANGNAVVSNGVIHNVARVFYQPQANYEQNIVQLSGNAQMINCAITNCFSEREGTIVMDGSTTLRNCLVADNKADDCGGIVINNTAGGVTVWNCTFVNNTTTGDRTALLDAVSGSKEFGVALTASNGKNKIRNCIFVGDGYLERDSDIMATRADRLFAGEKNTTADPRFFDNADIAYTLRPTSLLVGAGINPDWLNAASLDLAGNKRRKGKNIDLGAYECQSGKHTVIRLE